MVENFGSYLKHERELRGVTLEAISGKTKIHIRFLRALEDNNFEELPGEVFIKGYIRSYADIIGSDPEETLNVYEEFVGNKVLEKTPDSVDQSNISAINFLGYALIGLIILVLVFSAKFLWSNKKKSPEKSFNNSSSLFEKFLEKETIQEMKNDLEKKEILREDLFSFKKPKTKDSIDLAKEQETHKPKAEVQRQESLFSPNKEKKLGVLEKPLKLTIKVKSDSWFNMTIDNFREEDFILPAGEEKSFFGKKTFRLTIGNNKDTEVILNGKNLVIPYSNENVIKNFIITSKLIN